MANDVFDVKKKEKKMNEVETLKLEALLEISKSPTIRGYFQFLIENYNVNIISSSKPSVIEQKKTDLIEWHAKKDQLESMLSASRELKRNE